MSRVVVGVDPHKKSMTIEAVDEHGLVLVRGRYGTDTAGWGTASRARSAHDQR